ncbi:hypothetical protein BN873_240050 [Candidatus Competibacter denitrificans Run_A_D11]|uniref:Uncharacterized protein n=1 Tax=Candidatus Competibacter denitrificans Run_A_D11 TaxID=1400863 RepID=W6M3D4_9GAMM|nr:hypothetical protein BN873_240050 [Candidatus Competibacter denitrificans Run_A_D11]
MRSGPQSQNKKSTGTAPVSLPVLSLFCKEFFVVKWHYICLIIPIFGNNAWNFRRKALRM